MKVQTIMRCVVPSCGLQSRSCKNQDLTFHSIPKKRSLRTAWLKILGQEDQNLTERSAVCSKHFLEEDLYVNGDGVCRIRRTAVPIIDVQSDHSRICLKRCDMKVCRICFSTSNHLYSMGTSAKLEQAYRVVTGLSIERESYLPSYLCYECSQRLLNCVHFRSRSLRAHAILLDAVKHHDQITLESINPSIASENSLNSNLEMIHNETDLYDLEIEHVEAEETAEGDEVVMDGSSPQYNDVGNNINVEENGPVGRDTNDECIILVPKTESVGENFNISQEDITIGETEGGDGTIDLKNSTVENNSDNYLVCLPVVQEQTSINDFKVEEDTIDQDTQLDEETNNDSMDFIPGVQEHMVVGKIKDEEDITMQDSCLVGETHDSHKGYLSDLQQRIVENHINEGDYESNQDSHLVGKNNDLMVFIPDEQKHTVVGDIKSEQDCCLVENVNDGHVGYLPDFPEHTLVNHTKEGENNMNQVRHLDRNTDNHFMIPDVQEHTVIGEIRDEEGRHHDGDTNNDFVVFIPDVQENTVVGDHRHHEDSRLDEEISNDRVGYLPEWSEPAVGNHTKEDTNNDFIVIISNVQEHPRVPGEMDSCLDVNKIDDHVGYVPDSTEPLLVHHTEVGEDNISQVTHHDGDTNNDFVVFIPDVQEHTVVGENSDDGDSRIDVEVDDGNVRYEPDLTKPAVVNHTKEGEDNINQVRHLDEDTYNDYLVFIPDDRQVRPIVVRELKHDSQCDHCFEDESSDDDVGYEPNSAEPSPVHHDDEDFDDGLIVFFRDVKKSRVVGNIYDVRDRCRSVDMNHSHVEYSPNLTVPTVVNHTKEGEDNMNQDRHFDRNTNNDFMTPNVQEHTVIGEIRDEEGIIIQDKCVGGEMNESQVGYLSNLPEHEAVNDIKEVENKIIQDHDDGDTEKDNMVFIPDVQESTVGNEIMEIECENNKNTGLYGQNNNSSTLYLPNLQVPPEKHQNCHLGEDTNNDCTVFISGSQEHSVIVNVKIEEDNSVHSDTLNDNDTDNDYLMYFPDSQEHADVNDIEKVDETKHLMHHELHADTELVYVHNLQEKTIVSEEQDIEMEENEKVNLNSDSDIIDTVQTSNLPEDTYVCGIPPSNDDDIDQGNIENAFNDVLADSISLKEDTKFNSNIEKKENPEDFAVSSEQNFTNSVSANHIKSDGALTKHDSQQEIKAQVSKVKVNRSHVQKLKLKSEQKAKNFKTVCDICPYTTTSEPLMLSHLNAHASTKYYRCPKCYYITTYAHRLKQHQLTHTFVKSSVNKKVKDKIVKNNIIVKRDKIRKNTEKKPVKKQTEKKPQTCRVCKEEFKDKPSYSKHLKTHTVERKKVPRVRWPKFKKRKTLEENLKMYFGEELPFTVRTSDMIGDRHSGGKPFSCSVCKKSFREKKKLQFHVESQHSNLRLYPCNFCTSSFPSRSTLKSHIMDHYSGQLYAFDIYNRDINLTLHDNTATWNTNQWANFSWS